MNLGEVGGVIKIWMKNCLNEISYLNELLYVDE